MGERSDELFLLVGLIDKLGHPTSSGDTKAEV